MRQAANKRVDAQAEVHRLKTEFLASLNHEIRTPLSGIVGMMDLLDETRLGTEQREYVAWARMCAEDLLCSLSVAIEYAALAAGQLTLEEMHFNVAECLQSAVDVYLPKAAAKNVALSLSVKGDLPGLAVGDASRLREVLMHLVDNGLKFTQEGSVTVRASAQKILGDRFTLAVDVRDTGVGVPADWAVRIFESFQQGETGLDRSYAGMGMGLALARRLVAMMKGTIELKSAQRQGSTFRVRIPFRLPEESAPPIAGASHGRCVLIVEDNALALRVAEHVLRRAGYSVDTATSGEAAIEAASSKQYGLILMDLEMPGMGGFAAARCIRKLHDAEIVPMLALTAHTGSDYRRRCAAEGMQGFLSKPVRAAELLSVVRQTVRR
ncbi:MAG TPA: response regulator [Bryobacteraceae bacterium]|nr:response regulator [Bryobacteraceae bacterium]